MEQQPGPLRIWHVCRTEFYCSCCIGCSKGASPWRADTVGGGAHLYVDTVALPDTKLRCCCCCCCLTQTGCAQGALP
jgi:hypothetical protein